MPSHLTAWKCQTPFRCFPLWCRGDCVRKPARYMAHLHTGDHRMACRSAIHEIKVLGANMWPIWGRQDPVGPHVSPMNFAIWDWQWSDRYRDKITALKSYHKASPYTVPSVRYMPLSCLVFIAVISSDLGELRDTCTLILHVHWPSSSFLSARHRW